MTLAISSPVAPPPAQFTPDELLAMPDAVNYELVDGRLVERHMGLESSEVAVRVLLLLGPHVVGKGVGRLFGADAGYRCFPDDPAKVRTPDLSFIRTGRLPGERAPAGHCPIAPDLAVEVVSPNDLMYEVDDKVLEYLGAGVALVWVVNPRTRTVRVHRPRESPLGPISLLGGTDAIGGEDVIPGFSCPVAEFFG